MDNNKNFEEICFNFQQSIIKTFNEEQNLPFLLKYYLLKDIWTDIDRCKITMDQEIQKRYGAAEAEKN